MSWLLVIILGFGPGENEVVSWTIPPPATCEGAAEAVRKVIFASNAKRHADYVMHFCVPELRRQREIFDDFDEVQALRDADDQAGH